MAGGITQLYPDEGTADALKLQGVPISGSAQTPVDGQALVFDSATKEWVPKNISGGGPTTAATYIAPDGSHWSISVTNDGHIVRTKL